VKIPTFELEQFQSLWEHTVDYNLTGSGVRAYTLDELLDDDQPTELLSLPLTYGHTNGSLPLRNAIARMYPDASSENVLVTNGSAEANFVATWGNLNAGDEIVFMIPNYMQIWGVAQAAGAVVKPFHLRPELDWQPDLNELRDVVSPRMKIIAVTNPNNPTGVAIRDETVSEIARLARESDAWLFADEVYCGAELDGHETPSFWGRYEKVVVTGGLSKAYGMPGLRLGWLVGPSDFIADAWSNSEYTTIARGILSDRIATFVLEDGLRDRVFSRNRAILNENLTIPRQWVVSQSDLVSLTPPEAGGMAFVHYEPDVNSTERTTRLRQEHSVLIVSGDCFGLDRYWRLGFGSEKGYLMAGLERTAMFLAGLE
tara:strand:+ start:3438 stop:4550 length:1113 start_codon:yes stop_codon:yes gene_type:complete